MIKPFKQFPVVVGFVAWCVSATLSAAAVSLDQTSDHSEGLRENPPQVWVLQNATVIVSPEVTLNNASIVIRSGKIDAVGTDVAVPEEARRIDLTGRTVYAGFLDAYSEQETGNEQISRTATYWNSQVTPHKSVATAFSRPTDASKLRQQGIVAQLIVPADGIIRGQSAVVSTGNGRANDLILRS
ncbi:MAG: hypothetical protein KDA96_07775, partial [Planctomycetaceae bacterium]|nr:hypothetical protein [Planctomycetaceae bacterium]